MIFILAIESLQRQENNIITAQIHYAMGLWSWVNAQATHPGELSYSLTTSCPNRLGYLFLFQVSFIVVNRIEYFPHALVTICIYFVRFRVAVFRCLTPVSQWFKVPPKQSMWLMLDKLLLYYVSAMVTRTNPSGRSSQSQIKRYNRQSSPWWDDCLSF